MTVYKNITKTINWTRQSYYSTEQTFKKREQLLQMQKMWISKLIKAYVFQGLKMNAMDLE